MRPLDVLDGPRTWIFVVAGFLLVVIIGAADYFTGYELSLSMFYLIPIFLVSWTGSFAFGAVCGVFSALIKIAADVLSGQTYSHDFYLYWNGAMRVGAFVIVAALASSLKRVLDQEKEFSRRDFLTGVVNRRMFQELFQNQVERTRRYRRPFTLVYIDLDNFKLLNDDFGHDIGDKVLRVVAETLKSNVRRSDIVARLGGDEFAIILPECNDKDARHVIEKAHGSLLNEMVANDWPITFSIGSLTSLEGKRSAGDLLKEADDLMYEAKRSGKDGLSFQAEL